MTAAIPNIKGRVSGLFVAAALLLVSTPAFASANIDCSIDDKFVKFEMEAIAGRTGPIVQINVGALDIKAAAGIPLAKPQVTFDHTHIVQQWIYRGDLKLNVEIQDEKADTAIALIIDAKLNRQTEKFSGGYVLRVERGGSTKELKGRIKGCEAG